MFDIHDVKWEWNKFNELTGEDLYNVLSVRQEVFIVEQCCPYQDADTFDKTSLHLIGYSQDGRIIAYSRLNFPDTRYKEVSFGRTLVRKEVRGLGLGKEIVRRVLERCMNDFSGLGIRISAQTYLTKFYQEFGFKSVGKPYMEDGIEHVEMLKK